MNDRVFHAVSIGTDARRVFTEDAPACVEAVFQSSFYIRSGDNWACLGPGELGRGPLNVLLRDGKKLDWREHLRPGMPVAVTSRTARAGDLTVDIATAQTWQPAAPPPWTVESLSAGLRTLADSLPRDVPDDGLSAFIHKESAPGGRVARAAAPAIADLEKWWGARPTDTSACPTDAVRALLGMGPGLTPSGDDFLAGALTALRITGHEPAARSLWQEIERHAGDATSPLSAAHLRASFRSGLGETYGTLVNDVIAGRTAAIRSAIAAVSIEHCSPWDILAGSVTVLRSAGSNGD